MRFAIFGNTYQAKKAYYVEELFRILENRNAEIVVARDFYKFLVSELKQSFKVAGLFDGSNFEADMVISVGGDGTFLKAANWVGNKSIPILGINTGRLGFLADILPTEIEFAIDAIYNHQYRIEERNVIQLISDKKEPLKTSPYALNEIAILKRDSSSMITIHVSVNNEYLISYQADGLIIATPTGSTAYSLSVGGPVLTPQLNVVELTPVAPHSLNVRPIVLPDDLEITLDIESRSHNFLVAIDGRNESMTDNTQLHIRKADYTIKMLKRNNYHFFDTLRDKMMWGIDTRK